MTVSHLLYVDDTLLFCGADISQVIKLNLILHIFEVVSGLHTNMSESTIYPVNSVQTVVSGRASKNHVLQRRLLPNNLSWAAFTCKIQG